MPDFTSVVLTNAAANATFPVQAVSTGIAFASSHYKQVILKVPAAESYSVNAAEVLGSMMDNSNPDLKKIKDIYAPSSGISKGKTFWLRVITEVYYARAIDITGSNQTDFGATAGATTGSGAAISSQTVACSQDAHTVVNPNADKTPGGAFVVTHCGSSTVTLRKVFPQPIAIGTRGFVLKVKADGSLLEVQNSINGRESLKQTVTSLGFK